MSVDAALSAHPATAETARSSTILGIDPGPERSAWLCLDTATGGPPSFGILPNADCLLRLREWHSEARLGILPFLDRLVIEQVASFGMAVGAEVFETVYWSGRFAEAVYPLPVDRITRIKVKTHLCHDSRAKDANIRAALIDRYGGPAALRKGGDLYGVSKDVWSALACAVVWSDLHGPKP